MGFRDIFGKARHKSGPKLGGSNLDPRRQHYAFAHMLLPAVARREGAMTIVLLRDEERATEILQELWEMAGQKVASEERVPPDGLHAVVEWVGDRLVAIVTLPEPVAVAEAHFVALVSGPIPRVSPEQLAEELRRVPLERYFTLEYGYSLDEQRRTTFAEWTENSHLNFGDGPPPNVGSFLAHITKVLEKN